MDKETLIYQHQCQQSGCERIWESESKVSDCPRCGHTHIWFAGTSYLKEVRAKKA